MITTFFNPAVGVVHATVIHAPSDQLMFARNGEPHDILCHIRQGGVLSVTERGQIVCDFVEDLLPAVDSKIVLVRLCQNPVDRNFTKARAWTTEDEWNRVSWAVNAQRTYRAIGYDHRNNGEFQANSKKTTDLVQDTLINITKSHPRSVSNDVLEENHHSRFGPVTFSYKTRWYRLDDDGTWTECADPRPVK